MPHSTRTLPDAPGVGYKPQHFTALLDDPAPVAWLEIHAENYMGGPGGLGGRPLAQLRALAERFPISAHGVGLSIGGPAPLDRDHLDRLSDLLGWLAPASFSEHLAWSTHDGAYFNDLLPLPYTAATLACVCDHIDQVQDHLGRRMLLENPSSYLAFEQSTWSEPEFLSEIAHRTGCGLLLDVNNVFVSATNLDFSAQDYIASFALAEVGEIHLAGHAKDSDDHGAPLLIDDHGSPVADPVWALLDLVLDSAGPRPLLIERDNDVPPWADLAVEAARAGAALARAEERTSTAERILA
ncbi:DUF692 domain-containing protein [Sagittula salina]|uniref:UPF0276 protein J5474_04255 n=1 Tax=Sagittula salina TaxID=2820268 RepID=A0A940MLS6_9RHOB|nr:DUF692 domain-containing protein [Sagittula salina]MBP0481704.1 DUF692 domain-containing protein [Sagittula salina]